jgi:hypothetical protein
MKPNHCYISACRYCGFYNPEGRRGGICSQLNVSVKAHWKSCQFAGPAFKQDWQTLPEIAMLEKSFTLGCASPSTHIKSEHQQIKQPKEKEQDQLEETISSKI